MCGQINGNSGDSFIAASPAEVLTGGRTLDLDALLYTIRASDRNKKLYISVMDYIPQSTYSDETLDGSVVFFRDLNDAIIESMMAKNVTVSLLVSNWKDGRVKNERMWTQLEALQTLGRACSTKLGDCGELNVRVFSMVGFDETESTMAVGDATFPANSRVAHGKFIVAEGKRANIGTSNMAFGYFKGGVAGASFNTDDAEVVAGLERIFERDWESSYSQDLDAWMTATNGH